MDYEIDLEYPTAGAIAATSTPDGSYLLIDFLHLQDHSKAMRLGIPVASLKTLITALLQAQKALADPLSGIHSGPLN